MKEKRGFTLLEVIITTVIFVGALIPILSLYQAGFLGSSDTEMMTRGLNLARAKMEETKNLPYDDELLEVEKKEINLDHYQIKNVNTFLSDMSMLGGKIKRIVCVEFIDKDNNLIESDLGLKKITIFVLIKEKNKFYKKIELVNIRSRYF